MKAVLHAQRVATLRTDFLRRALGHMLAGRATALMMEVHQDRLHTTTVAHRALESGAIERLVHYSITFHDRSILQAGPRLFTVR